MDEDIKGLLTFILILVLFLGVILSCAVGSDVIACKQQATTMKMEWQYGLSKECMVEVKADVWVPLKNFYWDE